MKKLGFIILGFIIGSVLTYYFCPKDVSQEITTSTKGVMKPNGVISIEEAKELNDNWTKYRKAAVDSAAQKQGREEDMRSVGWSVADVRNYLDYAEIESEKMGYSMDSLRVYLGVYGEASGKENVGYTTMFMVPKGTKLNAEASLNPFATSTQPPSVPALNKGGGGNKPYNP